MASNEKRAQELADLFGRDIDLGDQSSASHDDTRRVTRQRRTRPDGEDEIIAYAAVYQRGTKLYLAGVSTKLVEIVDLKAGDQEELLDEVQVLVEDSVVYILVKTTVSKRQETDLTAAFDPFPTDGSLSFPNNNKDSEFLTKFELYLPLNNKVKNKYISKKVVLYSYSSSITKVEERLFEDSTIFDNSQIYARSYQVNYWPGYHTTRWRSGFAGYLDWTGTEFARVYRSRNEIGNDIYFYGVVARISNREEEGLIVGLYPSREDLLFYDDSQFPFYDMEKICIVSRIRYNQGYYLRQALATPEEAPSPPWPSGSTDPMPNPLGSNDPFSTIFTTITQTDDTGIKAWPLYRLIGNKGNSANPGIIKDVSGNVIKDLDPVKYGEYVRYSVDNIEYGQSARHPGFNSAQYFRPIVRFTQPATGRKYSIFGKSKFIITENKAWISIKGGKKAIAVGKFEYEQLNDHGDAQVTPAFGLDILPAVSATGFSVKSMIQNPPNTNWPGDISRLVSDASNIEWGLFKTVDGGTYLNRLYFRSGFHHTSTSEYNLSATDKSFFVGTKSHNSKAKLTYTSDFGDNFSCTYSLDEPSSNRQIFIPGKITEDISLPAIGFISFPLFRSDDFLYRSRGRSVFSFDLDNSSLGWAPIFEQIGLDPSYSGVYLSRKLFPSESNFYYAQYRNPSTVLQRDQTAFFGEGQPVKTMSQIYDSVFMPLSVTKQFAIPPRQPARATGGSRNPFVGGVPKTIAGSVYYVAYENPASYLEYTPELLALIQPILKEKSTDKILGLFFQEINCLSKKKIFFTPGSVSYKDQIYLNDLDSMKNYVSESQDYIISESEPILLGQFYNNRYSTQQKLIKNPYEPRPKQTDFISYFYLTGGGMRPSSYLLDNRQRIQRKQYIEFDRFVRDNKVPIPVSLPDGTSIASTFTPPTQNTPSQTDISLVADAYNLNAKISLVMPIVPPDSP